MTRSGHSPRDKTGAKEKLAAAWVYELKSSTDTIRPLPADLETWVKKQPRPLPAQYIPVWCALNKVTPSKMYSPSKDTIKGLELDGAPAKISEDFVWQTHTIYAPEMFLRAIRLLALDLCTNSHVCRANGLTKSLNKVYHLLTMIGLHVPKKRAWEAIGGHKQNEDHYRKMAKEGDPLSCSLLDAIEVAQSIGVTLAHDKLCWSESKTAGWTFKLIASRYPKDYSAESVSSEETRTSVLDELTEDELHDIIDAPTSES